MPTSPQRCTSVAQFLAWGRAAGIERGDTFAILKHCLNVSSAWLIAHDTDQLSDESCARIGQMLAQRLAGQPVAYLLGEREFFGLKFQVDARVLIPRPETELLVTFALEVAPSGAQVADIGTGSGAIALSVAHERPDLRVVATDISAQALELARINAARLGLLERVDFVSGDLLDALGQAACEKPSFHCILSNPPYIDSKDAHLEQGDLRFEPRSALTDGADGSHLLARLIVQAPDYLAPGGWLALEHGFEQGALVRQKLIETGRYAQVATRLDLAGLERMTVGQRI